MFLSLTREKGTKERAKGDGLRMETAQRAGRSHSRPPPLESPFYGRALYAGLIQAQAQAV